jgi:ABC-type antimicrobial peptide transport system permease subunit
MLVNENVKMALASLRTARWRSFLTMLGIIIGVASVVTIVSLGEGVQRQVSKRINYVGKDLITIRPGVAKPNETQLPISNLLGAQPGSKLSEGDVKVVQGTPSVTSVVPFSVVGGIAEVEGRQLQGGTIIATNDRLPEVLNQKVEFGSFFSKGDVSRHVAVIGKKVAEELFQENVPTGRVLKIRDQEFLVRGVFERIPSDPLSPDVDYNRAIFIPFATASQIDGTSPPIYQVLARAHSESAAGRAISDITVRLKNAHAGQADFTVRRAQENLETTTTILKLITQMIGGIAAISLLVGGIGIMNIMLVSVTERTREIGVRKALGATNRQILSQFLIEAAMLSFVGGLLGVIVSLLANVCLRIFTNLEPVITWPIMAIATGVALLVGIVFGLMPAVRAATKDPIDALRYE